MSERVFLGLGSNVGARGELLESALRELVLLGPLRVSSVYETPALLPPGAPPEWNKPFWNLAAELRFTGSPAELLAHAQRIENKLGRVRTARWEPRTIDIDLLHWQGRVVEEASLSLPHPQISQRAFVLDPLSELCPEYLPLARVHMQHQPRLMGILNLTPDSFAGGKTFDEAFAALDAWKDLPLAMIDIGGESTRPGATPLAPDDEWERIQGVLGELSLRYGDFLLRPQVSVDTRHASVAARALDSGADVINDVSGLAEPEMLEVVASSDCTYVLMHSLGVPADPKLTLSQDESATAQVLRWMSEKLELLDKSGVSRERVVLDPGLGFGKSAQQSWNLVQGLAEFQKLGCPVLIGHSRKSFLGSPHPAAGRDPETLGLSLALAAKGVDILRVHDPVMHQRALMSWRNAR